MKYVLCIVCGGARDRPNQRRHKEDGVSVFGELYTLWCSVLLVCECGSPRKRWKMNESTAHLEKTRVWRNSNSRQIPISLSLTGFTVTGNLQLVLLN